MPDVGGVVEHRPAPFDRREVFREGLEVPGNAFQQTRGIHVLDLLEGQRDRLAVGGVGRCDREAAVAGHDRRHAVEARRRESRIPEDLGVVVRMDVDEAGSHDGARGVERLVPREPLPDFGDPPVAHEHVRCIRGAPGPVDHLASTNHDR